MRQEKSPIPAEVSLADIADSLRGILDILTARLPAVVPGVLYLEEQIQANCKASTTTLNRWEQAGVPAKRPGTKRNFYRGDDVIAVMEKPSSEIPDYLPKTDDAKKAFLKRKPKKKTKRKSE